VRRASNSSDWKDHALKSLVGTEGALQDSGGYCKACGYLGIGLESPLDTKGLPCRTIYVGVTTGSLLVLLALGALGSKMSSGAAATARGIGKVGARKSARARDANLPAEVELEDEVLSKMIANYDANRFSLRPNLLL